MMKYNKERERERVRITGVREQAGEGESKADLERDSLREDCHVPAFVSAHAALDHDQRCI